MGGSRFVLLSLFTFFSNFGFAAMVETYGDSLTQGFFADTRIGDPFGEMRARHKDLVVYALTKKLNPNRAEQRLDAEANPQKAWPTPLSGYLQTKIGAVMLANRGVTAAKARDLPGQIVRPQNPDERVYAFFFMGHNDLCESKDNPPFNGQRFMNEYHQGLAVWDANHQNNTAFLVPIGDIPRVYRTLSHIEWEHKPSGRSLSCARAWKHFFPLCKYYTRLHEANALEAVVGPQRNTINSSLGALADFWNKNGKRGNRYVYLAGALDEAYFPEYFAVDCFHLSERGHLAIADSIFRRALPFL